MIPKSLHTITALVNVARAVPFTADLGTIADHGRWAVAAVDHAAKILGYGADAADIHGLKARAVAVLAKEGAK